MHGTRRNSRPADLRGDHEMDEVKSKRCHRFHMGKAEASEVLVGDRREGRFNWFVGAFSRNCAALNKRGFGDWR